MHILGSIEYITFEQLKSFANQCFSEQVVTPKIRIFGEQITIIGANHELNFSSSSVDNIFEGRSSYIIEGELKMEIIDYLRELQRICDVLNKCGYHFNIDYFPDKNDNSFEMNIRSQKYWNFMEEIKLKRKN